MVISMRIQEAIVQRSAAAACGSRRCPQRLSIDSRRCVAFLLLSLATLTLTTRTVSAQELYKDATASVDARVQDLLDRMTVQEKAGQMIQDAENSQEMVPSIGSYLVGASDPPGDNTARSWRLRFSELQQISANARLGIPLLFATDAIHGHNVLAGATIFPHAVGLGCTRNAGLVFNVTRVTAVEAMATGLTMTFAPAVSVTRTMTWGRTYESFSQDTDTVRMFVKAAVNGLQQPQQGTSSSSYQFVATAKHWIGDGGTTHGVDAGDVAGMDEATLLRLFGTPYQDAIAANVGAVMISFSSVNNVMMHQHQHLITDVLKGQYQFQGFVLSDWWGYLRNVPTVLDEQIIAAVNAGIDMLMCPYQAYAVLDSIERAVVSGRISQARLDDAVGRILRVKFMAGLFDRPMTLDTTSQNYQQLIGTDNHRAVARQAVRDSLVLLKNAGSGTANNKLLPLAKSTRVFVAGKNADNIQNQCGGWTMSWQGTSQENKHRIIGGTTVKQGLERVSGRTVTYSLDGSGANPNAHDVAIVVVGETPYAEGAGDTLDLTLDATDLSVIRTVLNARVPVVLVLIAGRPRIIPVDILQQVQAVVAAWLPGTEGDGIAQVLFGDYDFTGKLSFSWPSDMTQVWNGFIGDNPNVLYPFGYGLTYSSNSSDSVPSTPQVPAPTRPAPTGPAPTPSSWTVACSANPQCAGLEGACCPTLAGVFLNCCRNKNNNNNNNPVPAPTNPPPISPTGTASAAACSAHSQCAGLAGDCCPTASGVSLSCCGSSSSSGTTKTATSPVSAPTTTSTTTTAAAAACSAHSNCAGLAGDCCPTASGVLLSCCGSSSSTTTATSPVSAPSTGSTTSTRDATCAAHPSCAALTGNCCPTPDGFMLDCCQ